ncbi:MAG: hypothetical protein V3V01_06495 [Acidimicrobiales bacterium]
MSPDSFLALLSVFVVTASLVLTVSFRDFHVMRYVGVVVVAGLFLAACGGEEPVADPVPISTTSSVRPVATVAPTTVPASTVAVTTTVAPSTTVAKTAAEIEAEIIDAYLAGWDVFFQVAADPEADPAFAEESRQDVALEVTLAFREKLLARGGKIAFPPEGVAVHRPEFIGFEGDVAIVRDCFTDDGYEVNIQTGEISNDEIATGLWFSTLEKFEGYWAVTLTDRIQRWEGVVPTCEGPGSQSS